MLMYVPDWFKTQEMYIDVVTRDAWMFNDVPDRFKYTRHVHFK